MTYPTLTPDNPIPPYIDIMLDSETLGTLPGCKIISIGAKKFSTDGSITIPSQHKDFNELFEFYKKAAWDDEQQGQLLADVNTIEWWNKQSAEARNEAFSGIEYLSDILKEFVYWVTHINAGCKIRIWCKGAGFDAPIIEYALRHFDIPVPWEFYDIRCFRTLCELPFAKAVKPVMKGTAHNALDDAKFQAEWAENIFKVMKDRGMMG